MSEKVKVQESEKVSIWTTEKVSDYVTNLWKQEKLQVSDLTTEQLV